MFLLILSRPPMSVSTAVTSSSGLLRPSNPAPAFHEHLLTSCHCELARAGSFCVFPAPALEGSLFPRIPGSFQWTMVPRNQDLGTGVTRKHPSPPPTLPHGLREVRTDDPTTHRNVHFPLHQCSALGSSDAAVIYFPVY